MADLTTRAACKTHLSISATTWDDLIDALVTSVSAAIERYCQKTFASASYTEDYDGGGNDNVILRQYPVSAVSSVKDDVTRDFEASSEIDADDYVVDGAKGMVRLKYGTFANGVQNVRVAYTAGSATVPTDVALAAKKLVAFEFNRRKSEGRTSESLGGISISHSAEWPKDVLAILDTHFKYVEGD